MIDALQPTVLTLEDEIISGDWWQKEMKKYLQVEKKKVTRKEKSPIHRGKMLRVNFMVKWLGTTNDYCCKVKLF